MQTTGDGEFYPEKNLDRSYKIPRKGSGDMSGDNNNAAASAIFSSTLRQNKQSNNQTPLANSYYNYPYDPRAASAYYQNVHHSYQDFGNHSGQVAGYGDNNSATYLIQGFNNTNTTAGTIGNACNQITNSSQIANTTGSFTKGSFDFTAPPPPPPPSEAVDPIKKNIYDTLKDIKEKPKTYGKNIYNNNGGSNNIQEYGDQGSIQGYGGQGYNKQGFNNQIYGSQGFNNQGYTNQEYNNQGYKNQGYNNQLFNQPKFGGNDDGDYNNYNDEKYNQGYSNKGYDKSYDQNFTNQRYINQRFNKQYLKKQQWKKPVYEPPVERTVPDLLDESLPKDLKLQFQPLFCKLCSAQLSSNQTAKMHYKSKNHEKNIRKWLVEWAEKTGEPLPKRALGGNEKKEEGSEKNPVWFHCDICDLELTGKLHAESHYMGKNHQKALLGHKTPAGNGFYKDGKWVRIKGQKSKVYDFEKGEDNFGMDYKKGQEQTEECDVSSGEPPAKKKKEPAPQVTFHCGVCDINTTCQEQLDTHFRGQKHVKKLKRLGLDNYAEQRKLIEESAAIPVPVATSTKTEPIDPDFNLSVYRTPSGDYYCPTCNLTTNSEPQFIQHMKSKGHAKKASQKKSKGNS